MTLKTPPKRRRPKRRARSEFQKQCDAWLMSQYGTLLKRPDILRKTKGPIPVRSREIVQKLAALLEQGPAHLAHAKRLRLTPQAMMKLLAILSARPEPLIRLVARNHTGTELDVPSTLARALKDSRFAKKTYLSWEKVAG